MELISSIPLIGPALGFAIPFLIMLGLVIYVHEMGHYLVGRWCGIHAETFSMGFGKEIWSRTDKHGTKWRIAMIPFGGYVKFLGDADASSRTDFEAVEAMSSTEVARSFPGASVFKRSLTVAAGPVANFLLSAVIFTGLVLWQGVSLPGSVIGEVAHVEGKDFVLKPGDKVLAVEGKPVSDFAEILVFADGLDAPRPIGVRIERNGSEMDVDIPFPRPPLVTGVGPLTPASSAGLKKGDYIISAAGEELIGFSDLQRVVAESELVDIELMILRDGKQISVMITPLEQDFVETDEATSEKSFTRRVMIGISGGDVYSRATYTPGLLAASWIGVGRVWGVISNSFFGIKSIIKGDVSAKAVQGPLGMAQVSGEMFKIGVVDFIFLIGVISTGIGMLNLFPVPVLDGGHLMIYLYEAITGSQPPEVVMRVAMSIGLGLVLLLMVFATYNDVMRIFQVS